MQKTKGRRKKVDKKETMILWNINEKMIKKVKEINKEINRLEIWK